MSGHCAVFIWNRSAYRVSDRNSAMQHLAFGMNTTTATLSVSLPGAAPLAIHYLTAGSGSPLLLLHGLGDSAGTWAQVLPALARTHQVYALDLPGFGASDKPPVAYTSDFLTACVAAFMESLGLRQVAIVGNSLGGLIALRLALAQPERVQALVLVDSAGLGQGITRLMRLLNLPGAGALATKWHRTTVGARHWAAMMTALLFAHPKKAPAAWQASLRDMARTPGYLEATLSVIHHGADRRGQQAHMVMLDKLPRLTVPTLVLWGERDRVVPVVQAATAVELLANGTLTVIPDCGHVPQLECPDEFLRAVTGFLAGVGAAGAVRASTG